MTEVTAKDLCIKDKLTNVTERVPYGICVWSTGVAPVPITKTIMERIPAQGKGYIVCVSVSETLKYI